MTEKSRALHYYLAFQEKINKGHLGEYVAIYDNQVKGYYKNAMEGMKSMAKQGFDVAKVNINKCVPMGEAEYHVGFIPVRRAR